MATLPIRELGGVGIVSDTNPYDLPANAFSDGNNVIFDENRISRAPLFKQQFAAIKSAKTWAEFGAGTWASAGSVTYEAATGADTNNSRFVGSFADPNVGESVFVCDKDGTVRGYPGGALTIQTPATGTLVDNEEPWTATQVAGVAVLARKDMVPYARNLITDSVYTYFATSEWPTNQTCSVVRAYGDFLIALGVTKGTTSYPTMVKWSNPIQYGSAVSSVVWDPSNPANTAGENVLGELNTPIVDGASLGTQFIIYSSNQVWLMEYTGSTFVFNFRRLFPTGGLINQNCVVEIEGKHFVFGVDDIYVHDGSTKKSLADGRVRRNIFNTIDTNKKKRFFVTHDSVSNLIYFCYVSSSNEAGYSSTEFCNKAAVYNYRADTWSFMDIPNVAGGVETLIVSSNAVYEGAGNQYESYNTTYNSFAPSNIRLPVMLGVTDVPNGLTESRVYAMDLPRIGSISGTAHPETIRPAYVAREGIDLDEIKAELRGYKQIRSIIPQAQFLVTDGSFYWQLGSSDLPGGTIEYKTNYQFYPATDYKIDTKVAGRYLAYKITTNDIEDFRLSGFDMDVVITSKR